MDEIKTNLKEEEPKLKLAEIEVRDLLESLEKDKVAEN